MKSKRKVARRKEPANSARGEVPKRIFAFRESCELSQAGLARQVKVTQPMVSAWEQGSENPSPQQYVRLAIFAGSRQRYADAIYFLTCAGVPEDTLLTGGAQLYREKVQRAPESPVTLFHAAPEGGWRRGAPGRMDLPSFPLPAQFMPSGEVQGFIVDEHSANAVLRVGDVLLVDRVLQPVQDLAGLSGQVVAVFFARPNDRQRVCVGIVRLSRNIDGRIFALLIEPRELTAHTIVLGLAEEGREELTFLPGWHVLGKVVGWLRAPEKAEKKTK